MPRWSNAARQPPARPHPAVARIIVPEGGNTISYGSGTLVDVRGEHGLVITNCHVVREAKGTIQVVFPDGFECAAQVLKLDKDWDLAALAIWRPHAEPVPIAANPPQKGDALTIAGYGPGNYRAATGRCIQFVNPREGLPPDWVELSTEARYGDSGGPILNAQGELAGVLMGKSVGTTVGSHAPRVKWFLASLAPDMGKPDVSNIASRPLHEEQPPPVAPPTVKPFAPAIVSSPPAAAKPVDATKPQSQLEAFSRIPAERLTAVAPLEKSEAQAGFVPPPRSETERVASAGFGTLPGLRPLPDTAAPDAKSRSLEAAVDLSRPATAVSWQAWRAVLGDSLGEQIKSGLAGVGILTILVLGLRIAGRASPAKAKQVADDDEDEE